MARGENTGNHPGRQVGRARWEIVPGTHTGSERVSYSLTGHGNVSETHNRHMRVFGTREEAHGYMEHHGLEHHIPEGGLPPSDAGDVGYAGRRKRPS